MFLDSVTEINTLRKQINRLLRKEMSNIYLKINVFSLLNTSNIEIG